MQPLTSAAISASESGHSTKSGYSTRQSVASVTWLTRESGSNLRLSLAVNLPSVLAVCLRSLATLSNASSNASTKRLAAASRVPTSASRCLACASAASGVRRRSISFKRCLIASTKSLRRLGLSSKSSCKYGLRCTTHTSPSTSYSIRAERPVRRSERSSFRMSQAGRPSNRMTISRSEKLV